MRILTISNHYPPYHGGGDALQSQWFCEGLVRRGHRVAVLTSRPATDAAPGIERGDIPVDRSLVSIPFAVPARRLLALSVGNVAVTRNAIRRNNPDVVLCFGMDGVGFNTYRAAINAGRPSLTWLGDTWLGQAWKNLRTYDAWADLASGGQRPGIRQAVKRAIGLWGRAGGLFAGPKPRELAPVAAISRFVLDDLRRSGAPVPADSAVVPVILDPAFFTPAGDPVGHGGTRSPHLRALFVGRVELLKGPDTAIQGVAAAVASGADVRLSIAGLHLEKMRPELERIAASLGVADRIHWAGTPALAELIALYRSHDVFLFPSRIVEGLGVVNCEAMACGLPVIGTAHSGSADVIRDGETGFRVAKDDSQAVGRYLAELHRDRWSLSRLSESATAFSRRFRADVILGLLEHELNRVVNEGPSVRVPSARPGAMPTALGGHNAAECRPFTCPPRAVGMAPGPDTVNSTVTTNTASLPGDLL